MLLLAGGISSIRQVHAALSTSPRMPLIIVKGSGTTADLLAEAVEEYVSQEKRNVNQDQLR